MLTVRRIYLYAVSAVSLVAVTWAVISLMRLILDGGVGQGQITGLAWALAVVIVGLPIFLFHWLLAQRLAAGSVEERQSPVRHAFFYVIMAAAATPFFSNVYRLLDNFLLTLLDGVRLGYYPYNLTAADHLAALIVWGVVWVFVWRFLQTEMSETPAQIVNRGIRRVYLLVFSLAGLVIVSWGAFGLLQTIMEMLAGDAWRTPVANHTAQLLVGTAIWIGHWLVLQRSFWYGQPDEERSVLRKVYLYVAVFVFSVVALSGGTLLLKRLIELALGALPSSEPLLSQLSTVVPMVIVGGVMWAYHWSVVREDAAQAPDSPRQATVRRIYAYLVATVGLVVTLTGIGGLLTVLVDILTDPPVVGLAAFRESLASFLAMTVVGTPVWWLPWRARQQRAFLSPGEGGPQDVGSAERRSLVRKIYLYLFAFVAALVVFGSVGWFVFQLLSALLGADLPRDFMTQVLDAFVIAVLAGMVWMYHWWAIRQDSQMAEQEDVRQQARITVVVIDGEDGRLGQAVITKLHHDLPNLQLKPLGLTPPATAAMNAEPFSAEILSQADYVIGPWHLLTQPEIEVAVTASPATKFVIPVSGDSWVWTGVQPQSSEAHAEQVSRGLRQAIDGDKITFGSAPDLTTLVVVAAAGLLFVCIAGSLLVLGVNTF
jgi:hypothetical protein